MPNHSYKPGAKRPPKRGAIATTTGSERTGGHIEASNEPAFWEAKDSERSSGHNEAQTEPPAIEAADCSGWEDTFIRDSVRRIETMNTAYHPRHIVFSDTDSRARTSPISARSQGYGRIGRLAHPGSGHRRIQSNTDTIASTSTGSGTSGYAAMFWDSNTMGEGFYEWPGHERNANQRNKKKKEKKRGDKKFGSKIKKKIGDDEGQNVPICLCLIL
ncbi:hypothetical protein K461DRAFT_302243 [Myriangium duriaei CBS 260.36]|uniref:Uncharacterized protein n=1 Tax=Myriangium duriaei CBS 260.36 TaxID=1168546 RepID=A0A9P4IWB1_9PEZI|nr:hypothetical protein K461DRAFT_302243 [Myriangium duriaei CBS 260.36]